MYLFGLLLLIGTVATVAKAEVDCSQRPPFVNFSDCCELANVVSEDVKEICADQAVDVGHPHGPPANQHHGPPGHRGGPGKHGHHNLCLLSCVVNETGILVDNELQADNVVTYLNNLYEDSEQVEFLKDKFISCNEKHKEFDSKRPAHTHGPPHHCDFKENGRLIGCVHMHAFKDCPDSAWSNTDACNEAREHFSQCKPPSKENTDVVEVEEI